MLDRDFVTNRDLAANRALIWVKGRAIKTAGEKFKVSLDEEEGSPRHQRLERGVRNAEVAAITAGSMIRTVVVDGKSVTLK